MSKALFAGFFLLAVLGSALYRSDARALSAAEYSPYNAGQEAKETPAYKAEESLTGKGLYYGEAYAPNAGALVDAAARAPAPEGAYLIKEANNIAPAGVPQVGMLIDRAQQTGTAAECAKLAAAEKAAVPLKSEKLPALAPQP